MFSRLICFAAVVVVASAALPSGYESKTANEKQSILWAKIMEKPHPVDKLPTANPSTINSLQLMSADYDKVAFTWFGDEMQADREKLIHTWGSAAKVTLKIFPNSTYTGLFKAGSNNVGIARLSLAQQDPTNFIPGMALKFLVTGKPSLNLQVMETVDGQGANKNFFAKTFTNFIPGAKDLKLRFLATRFASAINDLSKKACERPVDEGSLPLYVPASFETATGTIVTIPKAPMVIFFTPNPAAGWSETSTNDLRINLAAIKEATVLYTVSVKATATSTKADVIGQLVLDSKFVASEYEDKTLYFKHHPLSC